MLATSKMFYVPGHNHLLTTSADDPTLIIARMAAIVAFLHSAINDRLIYNSITIEFKFFLESHVVECSMESFMHKDNKS